MANNGELLLIQLWFVLVMLSMDNTVGSLTERQVSILSGKLLGDGTLRRKTNTLLEINHSYKQKDYVFWLYNEFREFVNTPPHLRVSGVNRLSYRFTTISLSDLNRYYALFYQNGYKVVPKSLRLDPLMLAVWFMDDGSRSRSSVYFNTQQFSLEDQMFQIKLLSDLELKASLNKDKCYYRIRLSSDSMSTFVSLVEPYLLRSMRYKLPF